MCPGKKSVKSLVFYQTHSPFPEISMLNLFSFQDQKFGHKRRGAGHSGNNGHGGKEGGLLLSVPHLVSCKGHEVYGECWDGVKSLLKQCRTNLANMSTCTSPGDHTEYCSDIGKVASSICAMLWSFSQVFVLEPISYYDICRKCSASNRILSARDQASIQVYSTHIFATNRELSVFSWLTATCVDLANEINLKQFTLVKHCVWLDLSASYIKFLIMVNLSQSNMSLYLHL